MPHAARSVVRRRLAVGLVLALTCNGAAAWASVPTRTAQTGPSPVLLGGADRFAVLAGGTITNTGSTIVNGDLGGGVIAGFPSGTVNGSSMDATPPRSET